MCSENGTDAIGDRDAMVVMRVAADIVQNRRSPLLHSGRAAACDALLLLYRAAVDSGEADLPQLDPARRLELLESSLRELEPAIRIAQDRDAEWLRDEFAIPVQRLREHIQLDAARRRVGQAILLPGEVDVAEIPTDGLSDSNAGAYARALLPGVDRLLDTYAILDAHIGRIGRERFDRVFAGMESRWGSDMLPMEMRRFKDVDGARASLQFLRERLAPPESSSPGEVAGIERPDPFTDLVQLAIAISGGLATLSAAMTACVAELSGELQVAAELTGIAAKPALELAYLTGVVELVHGVARLLDPGASADAKLHAAVEIGSGMVWFAGAGLEAPRIGGAISGLVAVGYLIGRADLAAPAGVTGSPDVRLRFGFMAHHSVVIREQSATLVKARLLLARVADPGAHRALAQIVEEVASDLDVTTSSFLEACLREDAVDAASSGGRPDLRAAFASLQALPVRTADPGAVLRRATAVVERISEVLDAARDMRPAAAEHDPR